MDRAAALRAYAEMSLTARQPRDLEAEAFGKAIRLLQDAKHALPDFKRYADAVHFNQSLWNIVQSDLLAPDNPLPEELRSKLLQLSLFVDRRTISALGDPNGEHLQVLIDIDQHLKEGLQETPPR